MPTLLIDLFKLQCQILKLLKMNQKFWILDSTAKYSISIKNTKKNIDKIAEENRTNKEKLLKETRQV